MSPLHASSPSGWSVLKLPHPPIFREATCTASLKDSCHQAGRVSSCSFLSQGYLWGCPLRPCLPSQVCNLVTGAGGEGHWHPMETMQSFITNTCRIPISHLKGGTVHPSSATCQIKCERGAGKHTVIVLSRGCYSHRHIDLI